MKLETQWKPIKPGEIRKEAEGYRVTIERIDGHGVRAEEAATVISLLAEDQQLWNKVMIEEDRDLRSSLRNKLSLVFSKCMARL